MDLYTQMMNNIPFNWTYITNWMQLALLIYFSDSDPGIVCF